MEKLSDWPSEWETALTAATYVPKDSQVPCLNTKRGELQEVFTKRGELQKVFRKRGEMQEVFTKTGELQEVFTERASSLWALSWGCFMLIRGFNSWLCCCSIVQWCLPLCDPMDCSTPGCPVLHHLWEFAQTHVHQVSDAIQPSHPLSTPSPALNLSQHQDIFQ